MRRVPTALFPRTQRSDTPIRLYSTQSHFPRLPPRWRREWNMQNGFQNSFSRSRVSGRSWGSRSSEATAASLSLTREIDSHLDCRRRRGRRARFPLCREVGRRSNACSRPRGSADTPSSSPAPSDRSLGWPGSASATARRERKWIPPAMRQATTRRAGTSQKAMWRR